VVLIGAESTGKTTLAADAGGTTMRTECVAEYGREYWEKKVAGLEHGRPAAGLGGIEEFLVDRRRAAAAGECRRAARQQGAALRHERVCHGACGVSGTWGGGSAAVDAIAHQDVAHLYRVRSVDPIPLGGRSSEFYAGRTFDPDAAGGAIRTLNTSRIKITPRGIDVVEGHLARFEPDAMNRLAVQRLRDIAAGRLESTPFDLNFYSHELREFVRYRRLGWPTGQPVGEAGNILSSTAPAATAPTGSPAWRRCGPARRVR
jgi:hypothetical protein